MWPIITIETMIGKELKEWRKRRGLSQAALAQKLGVFRETVARWEVGIRSIPPFLPLALKGLETELNEKGGKKNG
jgi:transcriptional regulator with XRE-family HTH domain